MPGQFPNQFQGPGPIDSGDALGDFMPGNVVQNRELMYRLMISQLFYDGYQNIAAQLNNILQPETPCPPSERMLHVVTLGLERESESTHRTHTEAEKIMGPGLDLEYETEMTSSAPEPALYETAYVTSHKGNCRAGAFSPDGTLCATGSVDASIKVLDVERMLAKSSLDMGGKNQEQGHPVIRTLYDHMEEVTCLEFHPKETILASGSRDFTIKLFDYSKASAKKATKTITDAEQITTISFHPSGMVSKFPDLLFQISID